MYNTLLELKNKRHALLEKGKQLLLEKKFDEHKDLLEGEELKTLNANIASVQAQLDEQGRFGEVKGLTPPPAAAPEQEEQLDELRASKAYGKAFLKALAKGVSIRSGKGVEEFAPLYKALSISGNEGADGGFIVPVEFDNAIIRAAKDYLALADFFNVENVSTNSGWRAVETGTPKALPNIAELGQIGKDDQPSFERVEYAVKKFGDRLQISNELLEDESAGLLQYVAEWFAPKYILTQNSLLLPILTALKDITLTAGSEDKVLRQALIKELNTAHARAAQIITNQSGFAEMSGWEDAHKRALLVPDATAAEILRYRGKPVHYGDDSEFPTKELYVGNFKALGTLFVRKGFEMATTNVGGDAWATDSTELRVICRMDAKKVNGAAAFKAVFA